MEIKYFGGNCIRLQTKKVGVVIDGGIEALGLKNVTKPEDIELFTKRIPSSNRASDKFFIDSAGEYEISDVSIQGVAGRAHMDEPDRKSAVMYRLVIDEIKYGVMGHVYDITEEQLEALGMIDVLFIPVGGNGYTLDGLGALKLIKKIGPRVVVPTHYHDSKINYEVPQADLETVRKTLSMEPAEIEDSLIIKSKDFPEGTKLVILNLQ